MFLVYSKHDFCILIMNVLSLFEHFLQRNILELISHDSKLKVREVSSYEGTERFRNEDALCLAWKVLPIQSFSPLALASAARAMSPQSRSVCLKSLSVLPILKPPASSLFTFISSPNES